MRDGRCKRRRYGVGGAPAVTGHSAVSARAEPEGPGLRLEFLSQGKTPAFPRLASSLFMV
ncbi:hypothetical protein B5F44_13165 [Gordonibacter urolithinfaciens]|nr:hypothetical protein B5F44_13165 [Gordonibacter urolithinfaciens]